MQYPGPQLVDFDDVNALNRAFLTLLRRDSNAQQHLRGLRGDLAKHLLCLTPGQTERLATVPFLLFSLRERDRRFWDEVHAGEPRRDLFSDKSMTIQTSRLVAAGLGFIWQLARKNPYALRLICGASVHWCERLADQPLVRVLERATARDDVLTLRSAVDVNVWHKLLNGGVSRQERLRVAAQLSALHMMLTRPYKESATGWASAACRKRVPALSVADDEQG